MKIAGIISLLAYALVTPLQGQEITLRQNFEGGDGQTAYIASTFGEGTGPQVVDGAIRLLHGENNQANAISFDRVAEGVYQRLEAQWDLKIGPGGDGAGLAFLNTQEYGVNGAAPPVPQWEEPNLQGTFAVGFDIYNPPTQDPFDAHGNIYGRPEREVSLHWDGREVANRLSPVEYRTNTFQKIHVTVEFVCGGAAVSVSIGETPVYQDYFIPALLPYESRVAFGGRTGAAHTVLDVDHLTVTYARKTTPAEPPVSLRALDQQLNDASHTSLTHTVPFPENTDSFGRIICTLTLSEPPGGYDPWDRSAAIYVYDDNGNRFEVVRYITPYHRGHTWKVDVTDYRPLLRGPKKVEARCVTYGSGWLVTVDFDFYPGPPDQVAFQVQNLWVGEPEYGNPDHPIDHFFTPQTVDIDPQTQGVKLRFTVTGHGMHPNSENAAEFMIRKRTVYVNDHSFENVLWKEDNYLNPCRPQGGTWKYDRAGWAPGDVVTPWDLDLSDLVTPGEPCVLRYVAEPYVNHNRGQTHPPTHWVESQLIFYRKR